MVDSVPLICLYLCTKQKEWRTPPPLSSVCCALVVAVMVDPVVAVAVKGEREEKRKRRGEKNLCDRSELCQSALMAATVPCRACLVCLHRIVLFAA